MDSKKKIKLYHNMALDRINKVYEDLIFPNIFINATKSNANIRSQFDKLEYKKFTEDWIVNIESFFPSLNQIIRNLRNTLKYEEEILPIERTRRTNSESIRHLLRNTRYIREVNEEEIIPDKILNTVSEIDYGIYENRFIMTLIDRLHTYLLNRLETIKQNIHGYKQTNFKLLNEFKINEANYTIKFELNAKEDFDSSLIDSHNKRIYERTKEAYQVVSRMYHSDFMKTMSRYKKVKPPILKTQIILKNPDFRNAYMLWLFLDRLNVLDCTLEQRLERKQFDENYKDEIDKSLMMLFSTIFVNSELGQSVFEERNVSLKTIMPTKEKLDEYINDLNVMVPEFALEPNLATEYHLNKALKDFDDKYSIKITKNNYNKETLKQVLLDQYSIADQIFNAYFNIDQDDDVFDKLLTNNDAYKKYNEAYDKYNITKATRQIKEQLYLDSIILEDRWIKELLHLKDEAIESVRNKIIEENKKTLDELEFKYNEDVAKKEQEETEKTKRAIQNQRIKNNESIKRLTKQMNEKLNSIKEKEEIKIQKAKKQLEDFKKQKFEKIKNENKLIKEQEIKALKEKRNKTINQIDNKFKEEIVSVKDNTNNEINAIIRKMDELKKREYVNIENFFRLNKKYLTFLAKTQELVGYSKLNKNELAEFVALNIKINNLTVKELKEIAKNMKFDNYNTLRKQELINLIYIK